MNKRSLILFTNHYPFLYGETFLENEIVYLSRAYNKIYIFAIDVKKTMKPTRYIPDNVIAIPLGGLNKRLKYAVYTFIGIIRNSSTFKIHEKSIKKLLASFYIRGHAEFIANKVYMMKKKLMINFEHSIIYSYWFSYQAVASVILKDRLLKEGVNTTVYSRAHGYDIYWERVKGGYHPFQDILLKELNLCIPCSQFGKKYLLDKYPWAADKIHISRLGTLDHGLNPYKNGKTIVTCSNLEPLKRMSLLAKAFVKIAKKNPDLKWICIGDGIEKEEIQSIITDADVIKQVELLGRLDNNEVIKQYKTREIKYFVNISTTEGVPVSIMEAQSFGIPVIATDAGGTHELVNSDNGKLIPVEIDANYLAEVLEQMLTISKDEYSYKRIASRKNWEINSFADKQYSDFVHLISQ